MTIEPRKVGPSIFWLLYAALYVILIWGAISLAHADPAVISFSAPTTYKDGSATQTLLMTRLRQSRKGIANSLRFSSPAPSLSR